MACHNLSAQQLPAAKGYRTGNLGQFAAGGDIAVPDPGVQEAVHAGAHALRAVGYRVYDFGDQVTGTQLLARLCRKHDQTRHRCVQGFGSGQRCGFACLRWQGRSGRITQHAYVAQVIGNGLRVLCGQTVLDLGLTAQLNRGAQAGLGQRRGRSAGGQRVYRAASPGLYEHHD